MPETIITLYCFFDELLQALNHRDDPQAKVSTAEVMTIAAVAAEFFTGNQQLALTFLVSHGYLKPFSKSRFNRRLHAIPETLWQFALYALAQVKQKTRETQIESTQINGEATQTFLVDTFPVPVCRNIRIKRCKIYHNAAFRGYTASKKEYFYGLKVCLIVTDKGSPVELIFVPGSTNDGEALRSMPLNLPDNSVLIGDKGFLDIPFEEMLKRDGNIHLLVPRRKNMKPEKQLDDLVQWVSGGLRKKVETTFSQLSERLARSIHAVTPRGFELKVFLTVLTYTILK